MNQVAVSRLILMIMCASYLLSAALLGWARVAGQTVPAWKIAGWAVAGVAAGALLPGLSARRWVVTVIIFLLLGPWMAFALYEDARGRHYVIAGIDLAGLAAITYAVWLMRTP